MKDSLLHSNTTEDIIKAFYQVYNSLGHGFLEKVYENALIIALKKMGHEVLQQHPIPVHYENNLVGEYFTDLLIDNKIIVELNAAKAIDKSHKAQLLNYLKATKIEVGLLLNFGEKPEFKRKVFRNETK
ncbi:MAG: GxxExxY protein [Ignavibacteriae bacterium]|nr:GxxExxY protein [Ignavibacteriota bacterium]